MTKLQRLQKLKKTLRNPKDCPDCHGTGKIPGKPKNKNGCAKCLVASTIAMIRLDDFKWLLQQAEENLSKDKLIVHYKALAHSTYGHVTQAKA